MELLTPATQSAIENAAATDDKAILARYGRILAPMIESILRKGPATAPSVQLNETLNQIYRSYLACNNLR